MGIVVLATAMLAMLSMGISVFSVFGRYERVIIPIVVVWGCFILGLDCYLMNTVTTLWKVLPRVLLAIGFGVMIAEGLLLGLFRTAIEERIHDDRVAASTSLISNFEHCNPVPGLGGPAPKTGCEQQTLVVPVKPNPATLINQQTAAKVQARTLQPTVDADTKQYEALEEQARTKCDGATATDLSGNSGLGNECQQLREQAARYYVDHSIKQNQAQLARLNHDLATYPQRISAAQTRYTSVRDVLIESKRKELVAGQKEVGLLERVRALGHLAADDSNVRNAQWGLRIFLVLVDSLPVLLKYMNGFTMYDRRVAARLETQQRAGRLADQTELMRASAYADAGRRQIQEELARPRRQGVDRTTRFAADLELERAVAARAAVLRRDAGAPEGTGR
jgi:hypothetical protein